MSPPVACPTCGRPVDIPDEGWVQCAACGSVVTAESAPSPAVDGRASGGAPEATAPGFTLLGDEVSAAVPTEVRWPDAVEQPPAQATSAEPWLAPAPNAATGEAVCATHIENLAHTVCERCGDYMCRICVVPVEGRFYCPSCFDILYQQGAFQFVQQMFTQPRITLGLGITSLVTAVACCLFNLLASIPAGVAGLIVGLKAQGELRRRPELGGQGINTTGMTLAGAGLLISLLEIGFWILAMRR